VSQSRILSANSYLPPYPSVPACLTTCTSRKEKKRKEEVGGSATHKQEEEEEEEEEEELRSKNDKGGVQRGPKSYANTLKWRLP
jgi:hypothetical protein